MKQKNYSVVIVDDENCCIDNITRSLLQYPELSLIGTSNNTVSGTELIMSEKPDLLFLDVELPHKTGIELLRDLQDRITWNMYVVFYTAYDKYLLDALRVSAFDFLLKPYVQTEFDLIMKRFFIQQAKVLQPDQFKSTLVSLYPNNKTFMVATILGYQFLKVEDIVIFEYQSSRKVWMVELYDKNQLQLKRGTTAEDILSYSPSFIQISQHLIINFEYLSFISDNKCIMLPPFDNLSLKISRTFFRSLQDKFESI